MIDIVVDVDLVFESASMYNIYVIRHSYLLLTFYCRHAIIVDVVLDVDVVLVSASAHTESLYSLLTPLTYMLL